MNKTEIIYLETNIENRQIGSDFNFSVALTLTDLLRTEMVIILTPDEIGSQKIFDETKKQFLQYFNTRIWDMIEI